MGGGGYNNNKNEKLYFNKIPFNVLSQNVASKNPKFYINLHSPKNASLRSKKQKYRPQSVIKENSFPSLVLQNLLFVTFHSFICTVAQSKIIGLCITDRRPGDAYFVVDGIVYSKTVRAHTQEASNDGKVNALFCSSRRLPENVVEVAYHVSLDWAGECLPFVSTYSNLTRTR